MTDDRSSWQTLRRTPPLMLNPHFLRREEADALLATLEKAIPWDAPTLTLYGKTHVIPRSQCWMGDVDLDYRYSGRTFRPEPWLGAVETLRDRLVTSLQQSGMAALTLNSVLLNRYADGRQRMGWHSDDEPELGTDPVVVSVSLGAERPLRFRTRQRENRDAFNVWLPHGSVLLMGAGAQRHWQHALAPRAVDGVRINLTFRHVYPRD
ncbi:alpha-ketoglutarate-dependent dioxygenase AlkB family protein [Salinicola aestuarinus]|uniref:alpha-ketoglutarate-dependent dioxygenase AlkB family protein n=1 Tax=Salinicola aestuarinus TaxID=1949082 RepID=UPI001FDA9558|nr:alpha-ketoglutarate-dependent dioxygenase AlkB [Salinicola aestuarinus]